MAVRRHKLRRQVRVGDIHACFADPGRARQWLGHRPRVGLVEGLREFVGWASKQRPEDLYEKTVVELRRHGLFGGALDAPAPSTGRALEARVK